MASRIGVGVVGSVLLGFSCVGRADGGAVPCDRSPPAMRCLVGGPSDVLAPEPSSTPLRDVSLSTFWLDTEPVTTTRYLACVKEGACKAVPGLEKTSDGGPARVPFSAAAQFCTSMGKRLPTEWEWERASQSDAAMLGLGAWTSTWFASSMARCGPRCRGEDPRGPCDGATPCPGQAPVRVVKGLPRRAIRGSSPTASSRTASPESSLHTFRCASSSSALTSWPPRQLAAPRPSPPPPPPPTAEQIRIARAINEDELEKQVCEQKGRSFVDCRDPNHYIKTNEPRLHVWRPYIEHLGGGYVGVGIDQNYSFIAAAKSEWAWLFDYDPTVVRLHKVLRAIILQSPDRATFLSSFEADAKDNILALLSSTYKDTPERAAYREIYAISRSSLLKYYERQINHEVSVPDIVKAPTADEDAPRRKAYGKVGDAAEDPTFGWLATEDAYQYIRLLFSQERIHIMKGDMLKNRTMQGVGAAARALGVPIRIYYPSNAPECWPHTKQYKRNVLALPFDDASVVLTSLSGIKQGFGRQRGYWHYNVQAGLQQQELLARPGYGSLKQLVWHRRPGHDVDVSVCGLPGVSP